MIVSELTNRLFNAVGTNDGNVQAAIVRGANDILVLPVWLGPGTQHCPPQGVVPQSDDGVVVAKGRIDGMPVVVLAIEGAFQGGSMGEVPLKFN